AKNTNATYMLSNEGKEKNTICFNKGMRESGTPLAAVSLGLRYSVKGWYFNLNGNYYDRIYLSYSPNMRYNNAMLDLLNSSANADGSLGYITTEADGSQLAHPTEAATTQAKGKGGFMLDGSIGHSFRVAGHPLNVNLMVTNITNNRKLCTGGYEQSRSTNYTTAEGGEVNRTYNFQKNPKKFYAQGINFMLNLNYRF
ncbi:MAG: TonB-dependent receptor, partial [Bacteroidaceae bacterium]|nr:TonB-dependent receptor [Bacteroidaceae bacterium]